MKELNEIISKNIADFRKAQNMTQGELAEKINFSDKSISKWERGEAIPDVSVLISMSEIFGVSLDELVSDHSERIVEARSQLSKRNKFLIAIMSAGLAWLVGTLIFAILKVFFPVIENSWLCFIYAVPVSMIVFLVFSCLWCKGWTTCLFASLLVWTLLTSICLSSTYNLWKLFYVGIPLQILFVLWFLMKRKKIKNK